MGEQTKYWRCISTVFQNGYKNYVPGCYRNGAVYRLTEDDLEDDTICQSHIADGDGKLFEPWTPRVGDWVTQNIAPAKQYFLTERKKNTSDGWIYSECEGWDSAKDFSPVLHKAPQIVLGQADSTDAEFRNAIHMQTKQRVSREIMLTLAKIKPGLTFFGTDAPAIGDAKKPKPQPEPKPCAEPSVHPGVRPGSGCPKCGCADGAIHVAGCFMIDHNANGTLKRDKLDMLPAERRLFDSMQAAKLKAKGLEADAIALAGMEKFARTQRRVLKLQGLTLSLNDEQIAVYQELTGKAKA